MRVRQMLSHLPAYNPGRSVPDAVKLTSNETPYPPLPSVLTHIAEAAAEVNRYPDNFSVKLTAALASKCGVDVEQVRVGCGSISLLTQLVQAVADPGDEVLYAWRSFEAYPIMTAISGAVPVQVPLLDQGHDLDAMAARITKRTRLVFVCNPNNPTGTTVGRSALERFLRSVPTDVVVALDEAYREFVTDPDVPDGLSLLAEFPNVVVLRTFSKAYGLAGLRVGYAVAGNPAVTTALLQTQVSFAVTALAQAAALASLEPDAERELMSRVSDTVQERTRVRDRLLEMGYEVPPSQTNFVWLPLGANTVEWVAACEERNVIVRGFPDSGVRVTISSPDENDQFLSAAAQLA